MTRLMPIALSLATLLACGAHGDPTDTGGFEVDWSRGDTDVAAEGEDYTDYGTNPWVDTEVDAMSTFSVDVDTASYTIARRDLLSGRLPNPDAIRVEEFLNYFQYGDQGPDIDDDVPFSVNLEAAPSPFGGAERHLLRINLKAAEVPEAERDPVNLVFLLDVSGSMAAPNKLDLVKYAMRHLVDKLRPSDTLSIVVYAGAEGLVLPPTEVTDKSAILDALDGLAAGGSTNGEAGIRLAYDQAWSAFKEDGVNRVVLCTDGDFNVGLTGNALIRVIEDFRDRGVFLTTLGFGMGDYNDTTMEQLADRGDGNYGYIDSPNEAMRMLGDNLVSTLQVVAKDTKVQVGFDPAVVERWRLIGYENRVLDHDDFADDSVDAGDIGAGHSVTALYELELTPDARTSGGDLSTVALRYKAPTGGDSRLVETVFEADDIAADLDTTSDAFRLGAAVAEMAEILRESDHVETVDWPAVEALAEDAIGADATPIEVELLDLMDRAAAL